MKRLALAALLILLALPAAAFNPTRGDRIGVLAMTAMDRDDARYDAGSVVRSYLTRELQRHGFRAFNARYSYEDLVRDGKSDADFYVELVGSEATSHPFGGVALGDWHSGVDLAVVRSYTAARVRLYDGRTFEIIDEFDVSSRSTAVVPTSIGLGRRSVGLWIALPFVQYARYRAAARAVARDAADLIADASREEVRVN